MDVYNVYIKTDEQNRVTAINSDAFLSELTGWAKIDQGVGDRYGHAQGNYFPLPICDMRGVWRYAYVPDAPGGGQKWRERTSAEMDADYVAPEAPEDDVALLLETAADHEYRLCLMEMGVTGDDLQAV